MRQEHRRVAADFRIDRMAAQRGERRVGPARRCSARHFVVEPRLPGAARVLDQVVGGFRADLAREAGGAVAHQELVRQPPHDLARDADRMQETLQRADRAGAQRGAVHHAGVEFHLAQQVRPAAATDGAHRRVRLDQADAGLDRVERVRAFRQQPRRGRHAERAFVVGEQDHVSPS